jgi:hypothetical protein
MSKFNPLKTYHPAGILFFGLLIAQILATIQVYLSNIDLYNTVSAVNGAGYLAVPNEKVMASLQNFWPAFWGGLFFTCSIGAGISLGSMAAGWIWYRLFLRNKLVLFVFLSVWGGLLLISNIHGLALFPTLYFLLIAPALFLLTAKWLRHAAIQSTPRLRWLHLVPIPLLALLWFTQFDTELFVDLRDNLLLSNYFGKKFSHFYYDYTLYPAESFKSLDQKLIRTCRLENISNPRLRLKLANRLLANDYLPMPGMSRVDLKIFQTGDNLVFSGDDRKVLQIKVDQFFAKPQKALQKYSEERDRHGALRQFTYLSLLIGFPVLIYIVLHFVLYCLTAWFLSRKSSSLTASMLCLIIGLLVLIYFQANKSSNIQIKNIPEALESENLSIRIAALKSLPQKKLDIADYRSYPRLLKSPHPRERYWLVVAMAVSRSQESFMDLLKFLEDKNTNVRCMTFHSLGLLNNRQAIRPILEKIKLSHDWYAQLYAYKALRSLGWKQKKLP